MNFTDSSFLTQSDGAIRVVGSRLTLDTLAPHIQRGCTAAEIHDSFPSVSVEQIAGVMAWYKNHQAAAEEYLRAGDAEAERLRREIESDPRYQALSEKIRQRKEQLMARRY
ncbi:MAG TPA: DUF433 domain-containing protein [Pyrinomonadaceae bacterium]|nr:DUF433 domain-containing protein [Pyrinomonadaceae bacterium]